MELIASGRTAEVYAWEPGRVLKLFFPFMSRGAVEYEQRVAQAVLAAGVKAPAVGEIVEVQDRLGLVYERVEAVSMLSLILRRPWTASRFALQMAELHAAMHACSAPGLPPMHQRLEYKIRNAHPLPEALRLAALVALAGLPEGQAVCHGDFHPANILITSQGPLVIDWVDATAGHPLGDVARTILLVRHVPLPKNGLLAALLNRTRTRFYNTYIQRYFALSSYMFEQVQAWLPVVAAGRLDEGIREDEQTLLRFVEQGLSRLEKV